MTTDTLSAAAIGIGSFVVGGLAGGLVGKMTSKKDDALCGPYTMWDPDSAMCVIDTSQSPCDLHPTTVSCDDAIRSESTQLYIRPQTERYDRTRSVCDVTQSSNIMRLQDVSASECRDQCSIDLGCKHITNVKREYTYENNLKTCDPSDVSTDIHDSNYHACEQECNADPNCNIMQYSHNICRKYDMCTLLPRSSCANGALANLTYLDLHGNQIGDPGLKYLAKALSSSALPVLQTLYIHNNEASSEGKQAIIAAKISRHIGGAV